MKSTNLVFNLIIIALLIGCGSPESREAFKRYNEGVAISLNASEALDRGNQVYANELYAQSIAKFKQTLEINPAHEGAASAIGFSYYEMLEFDDAIKWLQKSIAVDSAFAINYQLLGLSQINLGKVDDGEINLERAFDLEQSEEFKLRTIENLVKIGKTAIAYGESATDPNIQINYKKFGLRVLISAFEFSGHSLAIGEMIDESAADMDDTQLSDWVRGIIYTE